MFHIYIYLMIDHLIVVAVAMEDIGKLPFDCS